MAVELTVAISTDWRESWSVPAIATEPPLLHDRPHRSHGERPISQPGLRSRRRWGEVGAVGAEAVEAQEAVSEGGRAHLEHLLNWKLGG